MAMTSGEGVTCGVGSVARGGRARASPQLLFPPVWGDNKDNPRPGRGWL